MSREACRVAVVAAIEAAKATWSAYTLVIEYDNRNVDIDALGGNPYLCLLYTSDAADDTRWV